MVTTLTVLTIHGGERWVYKAVGADWELMGWETHAVSVEKPGATSAWGFNIRRGHQADPRGTGRLQVSSGAPAPGRGAVTKATADPSSRQVCMRPWEHSVSITAVPATAAPQHGSLSLPAAQYIVAEGNKSSLWIITSNMSISNVFSSGLHDGKHWAEQKMKYLSHK